MSLHKDWVAAKKDAQTQFKTAEKNYLKKQDQLIKDTNDAKARKKALDVALGEAGLDVGDSLSDYLKFADAFGKALDEFENAVNNNAKLLTKYDISATNANVVDTIVGDKTLLKAFLGYCARAQNEAMIKFYMTDYKKSPAAIYNTYVAPQEIDLSVEATLKGDWDTAFENQTLEDDGPALIARTRDHVKSEIKNDLVGKFKDDVKANKELGFIHSDALRALRTTVRDTATKYEGQINAAKKRWSKHNPKFWTPLETCLADIRQYCTQH